jgi:uncharacterized RDD family membrane protein YckC
VARVIDGVMFGIVYAVLNLVLFGLLVVSYSSASGTTSGFLSAGVVSVLVAILLVAVYVGYEFMMTKSSGQTVGKMLMGIKAVQVGGHLQPGGLPSDIAIKRAGATWGGYILMIIPWVGTLNGASQLWDKPLQQTFADKFAGTVVVKIK